MSGELDVEALRALPDEAVCAELSRLPGVGVWTAEMLMTFSLQRPNVMSYGDLAIQRGLRMLYRHRAIDRDRFEKYRRRYAPYATVASLYLWAVAGGARCRAERSGVRQKKAAGRRCGCETLRSATKPRFSRTGAFPSVRPRAGWMCAVLRHRSLT